MSRSSLRIKKWNQLSQFNGTSSKIRPGEKTQAEYISTRSQGFKRGSK